MKVVAITGRSGAGKSTLTAYYASLGYPVLDADETARAVTTTDRDCLAALCEAFGGDILKSDGTLDRPALAAKAFASPAGARMLTQITHPAIVRRLLKGVEEARRTDKPFVFVDGAVIVGEAFEPYCDSIIVVRAPEREALSRVMLRDGVSKQAVRDRLAAQLSDAEMCAAADYVIENTGDERQLRAAGKAVLAQMLAKETNEKNKTTC